MENNTENPIDGFLKPNGPVCLIIKAHFSPISGEDRFQPAGFPQIGHVIYDAPREKDRIERVCIVDSAASMANHLESVCLANPRSIELHSDLEGLPCVICMTDRDFGANGENITLKQDDPHDRAVTGTLREGHRIASDYFLDGLVDPQWISSPENNNQFWSGANFRSILHKEFNLTEVKKNEKYYVYPGSWWSIFSTIFKYDPNSLIHGVLFAKEQIKISRLLTAHMEAFGAKRVTSSGVKFDPLGKTTSGQPIFSVDEETANDIRASFLIDLALLRSYGRDEKGLNDKQKCLLLSLALWKVKQLLERPFAFRSNCRLKCNEGIDKIDVRDETGECYNGIFSKLDIRKAISNCDFQTSKNVYYPANILFKPGKEKEPERNPEEESGTSGEE